MKETQTPSSKDGPSPDSGPAIAGDKLGLKVKPGFLARLSRAGESHLLDFVEAGLSHGELTLHLPSGASRVIRGENRGPDAEITFHNWRPVRRLFSEGSVGFADSYIDGDWDSPNLALFIELAALNQLGNRNEVRGAALAKMLQRLIHGVRPNSKTGSRKNIAAHYDLGNSFYEAWLDETMTYSSAIYPRPDSDLATAQRRKYDHLIDLIGAQPGQHILEIGGGWGGFAEYAAKERDLNVTSITISERQFEYASERIEKAGLGNRVSIELKDYRDVEESFDHIVSIEMFEAVGEAYWPSYFNTLHDRLKPGGRAGLQVIYIHEQGFEQYRKNPDFIQTHIFPGGMLPSPAIFDARAAAAGLVKQIEKSFRLDYARTLREWRERFERAVDENVISDV
ncbi:MAG: cyclopropane-fatty-acyl-phospholipid synthase family protein, partial [Alphaproteobacteria bacterium]|nr:cyclopropane-fatty-acyl-phospholipid synthase family protein [Alphaproteobacteria bacterium]